MKTKYRRLSGRRCYLGRGSQTVLSRPRLTEDAISAEAHITCYHGRGSQERAISAGAHKRCYLGRGSQNVLFQTRFFSSNFLVVALRAPWLNLYFYRIGVWKSWRILDVSLWWWFWQFTIHRWVGERTSYLSSVRKNVPSQLGAWKRPISTRRVRTSHPGRFVYRRCEQSLSRVEKKPQLKFRF